MKLFSKHSFLCLAVTAAALVFPAALRAQVAHESDVNIDEARWALDRFLFRFDRGYYYGDEDTEGFHFLYSSHPLSAFSYDIYGTTVSSTINRTILRVEGGDGDAQTMARVLELEGLIAKGSTVPADAKGDPVVLSEKSHLISQSLNLAAPWLGVWYNTYNTPRLTLGQTWFRFGAYFLADGFLLWAGGTKLWSGKFDASKNGEYIIGALAIPRTIGAVQSFNLVRGHNKLAEFKYTFYLD